MSWHNAKKVYRTAPEKINKRMNMKRHRLKYLFIPIALLLVTVASVGVARYHTIANIPAPDKTPHLQVNLTGKNFKPDQNYILTLETGDRVSLQSNSYGEINAMLALPYKIGVSELIRLNIEEDNPMAMDTPALEILFDTKTKSLSWSGQYFPASKQATLSISNKSNVSQHDFYTDWSGQFKQTISYKGIDIIKENICFDLSEDNQQLCLSFGVRRSPELLKVFTVSDASAANTSDDQSSPFDNWVKPADCEPGPTQFRTQLSLCYDDHVAGLWDSLYKSYYDFSRMTLQLSAGMMQQVGFIGILFDAKQQLETQLLFWEKQERAHDDYTPSEQLCSIASMTKGLVETEMRRDLNTFGITRALAYEEQNPVGTNSAQSDVENYAARAFQFKETYCSPSNFNNSLRVFCDDFDMGNTARINRDINYSNLISIPKTLEVNITDGLDTSADEEDVMSMGRLLFGHKTFTWPQPIDDREADVLMNSDSIVNPLQEYRSISAIRDVARHSYANIVGMKSEGSGFVNTEIKALLEEFGMPATDIDNFIGTNPSYFAQMDVLTKKVFQHPNFYTNLITKEANITRFEVTMDALQLMSKRDRYETALRKEMLLSLLIEMKLRDLQDNRVDESLRRIKSP